MPLAQVFLAPCVGTSESVVDARPAERGAAGAPPAQAATSVSASTAASASALASASASASTPRHPRLAPKGQGGCGESVSVSISLHLSFSFSLSFSLRFSRSPRLDGTSSPAVPKEQARGAVSRPAQDGAPARSPEGLLQVRAPGPSRNFSSGFHLSFSFNFSLCISLDSQTLVRLHIQHAGSL